MLPNKIGRDMSRVFILLPILFWSLAAFAQSSPVNVTSLSAQTMLENLAEQIPYLMQMVTAISYVMGMYFIIMGVIRLKHVGESRTMMSQEHGFTGPIVLLVVGSMLLYIPTAVQVGLSTFWADPNPYGYTENQSDQWSAFINDIYIIVQLVGTIAFIRGLVILTHLSEGRAQPGTVSRAITHLVGGIFCINIYQTIQVVLVTLGIQT